MGGEQYVYSEGDTAWFSTFLARVEKQSKGYPGISLTNFATSTVCAIAAGSVVEIDGAMFHFAAEASVSGAIATGLNYIICSVTGTTAEPYWSQDAASVYDTAKQGFYTAAERYVAGCTSDGATYDNKWVYENGQRRIIENIQETDGKLVSVKILEIGDWNMKDTTVVNITHGVSFSAIRAVHTMVRNDSDTAAAELQYHPSPVSVAGGYVFWDSTDIVLTRNAAGVYDDVTYNSTSYNRGWVTFWYAV